jgi:hypothetical protein
MNGDNVVSRGESQPSSPRPTGLKQDLERSQGSSSPRTVEYVPGAPGTKPPGCLISDSFPNRRLDGRTEGRTHTSRHMRAWVRSDICALASNVPICSGCDEVPTDTPTSWPGCGSLRRLRATPNSSSPLAAQLSTRTHHAPRATSDKTERALRIPKWSYHERRDPIPAATWAGFKVPRLSRRSVGTLPETGRVRPRVIEPRGFGLSSSRVQPCLSGDQMNPRASDRRSFVVRTFLPELDRAARAAVHGMGMSTDISTCARQSSRFPSWRGPPGAHRGWFLRWIRSRRPDSPPRTDPFRPNLRELRRWCRPGDSSTELRSALLALGCSIWPSQTSVVNMHTRRSRQGSTPV